MNPNYKAGYDINEMIMCILWDENIHLLTQFALKLCINGIYSWKLNIDGRMLIVFLE